MPRGEAGVRLIPGISHGQVLQRISRLLSELTRRRLETLLQEKLEIKWGHMLEDISSYESEHFSSFKKKDNIHTRFLIYLESTPQSGNPYCLDHN
jgi:hypothetical protein